MVEGDGIDAPLELSYDDIRSMPQRSLSSCIECGGNHRAFFDLVMGRAATGTQWKTGGIGMAEWRGVPLVEVLDRAGLRPDAADVLLVGLDTESPEGGFRKPIPVDKAIDTDTLLALEMNGVPLPPDHGFPLRAVVPGWVGSASIKWLGRIEVSTEKLWTRNNTTSYVLIGEDYPPEGDALGQVARIQSIKSALALPWPATMSAGPQRILGYAHSARAPIAEVHWSVDDGQTWHAARVLEPRMRFSWARFEIDWEAQAGAHTITTRATDAEGNTQPDTLPFNEKGYLFNLPLPHPVAVT